MVANQSVQESTRRLFDAMRETGERVCGERVVIERLPQYFWMALTMNTARSLRREMCAGYEVLWAAGCLKLTDN